MRNIRPKVGVRGGKVCSLGPWDEQETQAKFRAIPRFRELLSQACSLTPMSMVSISYVSWMVTSRLDDTMFSP